MTRWATQKQIDRLTKKTNELMEQVCALHDEYKKELMDKRVLRHEDYGGDIRCVVIGITERGLSEDDIELHCEDKGGIYTVSIQDVKGRERKPRPQ